jgi:hypothetical protein
MTVIVAIDARKAERIVQACVEASTQMMRSFGSARAIQQIPIFVSLPHACRTPPGMEMMIEESRADPRYHLVQPMTGMQWTMDSLIGRIPTN